MDDFDKRKTLSEKINYSKEKKENKRLVCFNHDSFFGWRTKSALGRKTEFVKLTRNKNLQIFQHKKYEKRSSNVWRRERVIFEQKIKT